MDSESNMFDEFSPAEPSFNGAQPPLHQQPFSNTPTLSPFNPQTPLQTSPTSPPQPTPFTIQEVTWPYKNWYQNSEEEMLRLKSLVREILEPK